jgi:hypothetical protein
MYVPLFPSSLRTQQLNQVQLVTLLRPLVGKFTLSSIPSNAGLLNTLAGLREQLMMEAVRTSETSVDNYFTRQYIPEDNSEHHTRRRDNLKSHTAAALLQIRTGMELYCNCK